MQPVKRVMIIGLDGATWDVLDPWMRDGTLPHLAGLRARGSWGPLQSSIPPITAAAWSTFMTGKRPGKHGVYHFVKLFDGDDAGEGPPELVDARTIQSAALWDVMSHHQRRVVLINIPLTYPPRPVNGVMVTGLLTPRSAEVFTYPPELSRQITDYQIDLERFSDKTPHVDAFDAALTAPSLALVAEFRAMEEKRARLARWLMESEPWDFFMVVFTATDRMGHYLWPYHRSPHQDDRPEVRQLCEAVRAFYVRLDQIVGEMVSLAGPDTTVIVISDHGMGPVETKRFHGNNWLYQHGWLATKSVGHAINSPDRWLARLGLPRDTLGRLIHRLPGLAQSRVVKKAIQSRGAAVDLERSQAYCVPIFYNIAGIRLRLEGPARAALCREIMREIQALVDPDTGQPIVSQVLRASEYYAGPHAHNIPDLLVILEPDYAWSYFLSHYSSLVTRRPVVAGPAKHRSQGIFLAAGPGVAVHPHPLSDMHIEDIAPTALYLMNLPLPTDLDGRVLSEALDPALLAEQPLRQSAPVELWGGPPQAVFADEAMSEEDEAIIRDRLRALGYFE